MDAIYNLQDRGNQKEYQRYLEAMDAVAVEKVASASVFFAPEKENVLVDVGMASGTSSAILANLFPELSVIGIDINPKMIEIAQKNYQLPNLSFREDDGEALLTFEPESVNGFFNCSSIHHITSYNGYDGNRAFNTLKRQTELLKKNGVIVVRDFVKPEEQEVLLEVSSVDKPDRPGDADLLKLFSQTARSLSIVEERGFPLVESQSTTPGRRRFRLYYSDAVEFIRRKDYYENWEVELQEEYGYFTQHEFEENFSKLGLRIILSTPIYNPWIIHNRYKEQFTIYNLHGQVMGYPPTNYLIVGEKVISKGKRIYPVRHLPANENLFLSFTSYQHKETEKIYDVVERPNEVVDFIPFYQNNKELEIWAKHGYPRPILNAKTDSPSIDGKHYSGYITEGITAGKCDELTTILYKRTGIKITDNNLNKGLSYYTSPGGIKEKITSFLIELDDPLNETSVLENIVEGLEHETILHKYNATQLLKTAQTGALVEARLEMNIYNIFRKLSLPLPQWLGEKIELFEQSPTEITSVQALKLMNNCSFERIRSVVEFLRTDRVMFATVDMPGSKTILEYAYPADVSTNTLLTLPVCRSGEDIFVGLEIRDLPVPQQYSGNSCLATAFAKRLPKSVRNYTDLEVYIKQLNVFDASVTRYFKLGEKYYPSIGVTPEQVYPYVVQLDRPTSGLKWISLHSAIEHLEQFEDGHLLICLLRLWHAIQ